MAISQQESVELRDATTDDIDFLAWVMLAASRSHLDRGIWEYLYDLDEAGALELLRRLATTATVHLFHHSLFVIAQVNGHAAAAMCGYDPQSQGFPTFNSVVPEVAPELGIRLDGPELARRLSVLLAGFPESPVQRPWTIENVATVPQFRRQGLVDRLLAEVLKRGQAREFDAAQIGVFIGNEPARRAYLKAGFRLAAEKRDDGWDAEIGCPGTEQLLLRLR
ncbi:MAG TPA: GNAT family N-acetyltransferase [Acidimicrobiales bacterium]|jgi:ribosomal protein S18 acetylase RimI-like enzyme